MWVTTGDKSPNCWHEQAPLTASFGPRARSRAFRSITIDTPLNAISPWSALAQSITDASAWLIQTKLTPADQRRSADGVSYLGAGEGGLGFSFTRVTIGASDFSRDHYSLDDAPGGAPDPELKSLFDRAARSSMCFPTVRAGPGDQSRSEGDGLALERAGLDEDHQARW